jgi:para-nitrobenzyl esterase
MAMPSAKGLFHKAINQSGSFRMNMLEKGTTQAIATEVLKALNLSADQADSLQNLPYSQIVSAGRTALKNIADKMKAEGKPVLGFGLGWGPSVDGEDLPYQLFSKEAFELSKDVPLLIGTVKNEFTPFFSATMSNASREQVIDYIKKQQKEKADAYIAAVKKAYPADTKPSDLISVDVTFRPGAVAQANQKSSLNAAPVYMYLFTWQSPVMDGKFKAVHCMELPFMFNNIARCEEMTGGTKEAYVLADKMSKAWIQFARTGNPSHKGLPTWPVYNSTNTATMHFDNKCEVKPQMDKELFALVSPAM